MSVDLPTFGKPRRPASASTRSSRRSVRRSPGVPGSARRGARLVGVAKCMLPRPPRPPRATIAVVAGAAQVGQLGAALVVVDERPRRHAQHEVGAARAVLVLATPVLAALGAQRLRVGEVEERREAGVDAQHDVAAVAAVAAARPAARHVLLAPEAGAAVAAVAGLDADAHLVDELHEAPRW